MLAVGTRCSAPAAADAYRCPRTGRWRAPFLIDSPRKPLIIEPTIPLDTILGSRFGRYELLAHVGAGGMGEVFRARDHDLHRDVAIKFLPERFASDPERLARFAQEARTASGLNHPNIVTIHEIGNREGRPYIVMEYVDGETLRSALLLGKPLPAKQVLDVGAQLAEGLAKAHDARVVHRDLKPENVMITKDGFAKILDFGLE